MGNSYAYAGKRIADRFELAFPASRQDLPHASVWLARDTARSVQVRAIVIDPEFDAMDQVLDAARRTAYVHNNGDSAFTSTIVPLISLVDDATDHAVITDLPFGYPLSELIAEGPVAPELVRSIIGEVTSALNSARHQRIWHLALTPEDVFITDAGKVIIDGYGIKAALLGVSTDQEPSVLDHYEASGIINTMAELLLGRNVSRETFTEVDSELVNEAALIPGLSAEILSALTSSSISQSLTPNSILLNLVPWNPIDTSNIPSFTPVVPGAGEVPIDPLGSVPAPDEHSNFISVTFPKIFDDAASISEPHPEDTAEAPVALEQEAASDIATEPEETTDSNVNTEPDVAAESEGSTRPAETLEEAADKVDTILGVTNDHSLSDITEWPKTGVATAEPEPEPEPEPESITPTPLPSTPEPVHTAPTPQPPAFTPQSRPELTVVKPQQSASVPTQPKQLKKTDTSSSSSRFVIVVLTGIVFVAAILGLTGLFQPLKDVNVAPPKPHSQQQEVQKEKQFQPPAIESAHIVDPDSAKYFSDPETPNYPDRVPLTIDGDPKTRWETWYFNEPGMGAISGIGVHVTLKKETQVSGVVLNIAGKGGLLHVKTGNDPKSGELLYEGPVDETTKLTFEQKPVTKDLLFWFTELPVDHSQRNRLSLAEISVE